MSFEITKHKGFHIYFTNGWGVSVQWGPGNYCEHYMKHDFDEPEASGFWVSEEAEITVFDPGDCLLTMESGDCVEGWCSAERVAHVIGVVARLATDTSTEEAAKLIGGK